MSVFRGQANELSSEGEGEERMGDGFCQPIERIRRVNSDGVVTMLN